MRLATNDLVLLPVAAQGFHCAAELSLDAANGLRAGEAMHLGSVELAGANNILTLDAVLARSARRLKMKLVAFPLAATACPPVAAPC